MNADFQAVELQDSTAMRHVLSGGDLDLTGTPRQAKILVRQSAGA
jgi:hypothetical protein